MFATEFIFPWAIEHTITSLRYHDSHFCIARKLICNVKQNLTHTIYFYRPQTKLRKGYVFTPVCHSVHRRGLSAPVHAGMNTPLGRQPSQCRHPPGHTPPWADTPWEDTPMGRHPPARHPPVQTPPGQTPPPPQKMAIAADGMHPTGMHSCFSMNVEEWKNTTCWLVFVLL